MKDEYISVSEFARRAGVTKQSVYQRIQGRLKKYVKDLNGKKVIHIKALYEVYGIDLEQGLEQDLNNGSQGQNALDIAVVDLLRAELEAKNRQLEAKDQQLREKDQRIAELTDRITEMGKAAQALHAGTMQQQLGPGADRSQEPEPVIDVAAPAATPESAQESEEEAAPDKPGPEVNKRKRHWWPWQRR